MKSFFTVFLKIIMVASFVAVIAFVAVVLINNVNVAYDAYATISASQSSTPYESFADRVDRYVRKFQDDTSTTLIQDDFALFLNDAMLVLNDSIDYYVDYLSIEKDLSKKEQLSLSKSYTKYKESFDYTITCYNSYMEMLRDIIHDDGFDHHWTSDDIAKRTFLASREEALRLAYKDAYLAGSSFFKTLQGYVRGRAFSASLTFDGVMSIAKVAYADRAVKELFSGAVTAVIDSPCARDFYQAKTYGSDASDYSDAYFLVNNDVFNFSSYASELDIFSLICDYDNYLNSLTLAKREKAVFCHDFLQANVG